MADVQPQEIRARLDRTRALARLLAARHPGLEHYEFILNVLDAAEGVSDARERYEIVSSLQVFAVREFVGAEGEYAQVAKYCRELAYEAWKLAGRPDDDATRRG